MATVYMSGDVNCTFIHVPKTAGTTVGLWMQSYITQPGTEVKYWDYHPLCSSIQNTFAKNFTFTVVRNPWDRMVSYYNWVKDVKDYRNSQFVTDNNLDPNNWPSFEWFITNMDNFTYNNPRGPYKTGAHAPQVYWHDGQIDAYLKFENLDKDFVQIQNIFECHEPLEKIKVSRPPNDDYKNYYNDTTKAIVDRLYAEDIERFGYTF
jgi:hypothetical protein